MKRRINGMLVKQLRTERRWSQDELAIASGLSTRTIQRLESEGSGSTGSLKSIAAALEVEIHNLEERSPTQLTGLRWGLLGIAAGSISATVAILTNWIFGDGSSFEAGVSLGFVGLIAGLSCSLIGLASARY